MDKNNSNQPEPSHDTQYFTTEPTASAQVQYNARVSQELYSPERPIIIERRKARVIGIIGIILPIGIQDFVTKRYFWGFCHLLSPLMAIIGALLFAFDGYCAGGKICTSPPGILALIGAFLFTSSIVFLVLNLFECVRLMTTGKIEYSKKSFSITMFLSIFLLTVLLFALRVYGYHS